MNSPSLRSVNSGQNQLAGSYLGSFYSKCSIRPSTDSYRVVAMRGIDTGYICGR
jgi:hypothetical protein